MVIEPIDWHREELAVHHWPPTPMRTPAEIISEVWALEAVANDLPPDPNEVDAQAIAAAQHALLWAAGLLSPMELPPSVWAEPVGPDDDTDLSALTSDQVAGRACLLCHRPAEGAEMVDVSVGTAPLIICADYCDPDVVDEPTSGGRTLGSFLAAVVQDCIGGEVA